MRKAYSTLLPYIYALLAGLALPFAFAPYNQFWLALIIPAILWHLLQSSSPRKALWQGFIFGIGLFSLGVSWVYNSIHVYGQTPALTAIAITAAFVLVLAIFFAGFAYSIVKLMKGLPVNFRSLIAYPSLWVLWEALRGWAFTGFPWLFIGYTQIDAPLVGFAPIVGIYGISWLTVFSAGLLLYIIKVPNLRSKIGVGIFFLMLQLTGWLLQHVHWTKALGNPIDVVLVQPYTPQELKWVSANTPKIIDNLVTLSKPYFIKNNQIIIWPEAAIPLPISYAKPLLDELALLAREHNNTFITGILNRADEKRFYNSILAVGNGNGIYYKQHLVPFGEYMPYEDHLGKIFKVLSIPRPATQPGDDMQFGLQAGNLQISPAICYEIAYPSLTWSNFIMARADLLLTISNDTWFGDSLGPHQHLQIARMRALELGRYLLRGTNNGMTAIIDEQGKVTALAPRFQATVLTGTAEAREGKTPLGYYGHGIVLLFIGLLAFGIYYLQMFHKSR